MTTTEIAAQLVALCSEGRFLDAVKTLYADNVVSVEASEVFDLKPTSWDSDTDVEFVGCRPSPSYSTDM